MKNLQNQVETTSKEFKEGGIYYGTYNYSGCSHSFYQIIKYLSPKKVVVRQVALHYYNNDYDNNPAEMTYKVKVNDGEILPPLVTTDKKEQVAYIRNNKIKIDNYLYLKPSRLVKDGDTYTDCDYR